MGFWVIAHECGHGAFSKNKVLETTIGYLLHSLLLVPYFSWQRSHAVHHRFTNNVTNGETHVPLVVYVVGIATTGIHASAVITVDGVYDNVGDVVRITGVTSESYSGYNNIFRISEVHVGGG